MYFLVLIKKSDFTLIRVVGYVLSHFILLSLSSCSTPVDPPGIQAILKNTTNQGELKKVIRFYSNSKKDSLKLRAAYFLIENTKEDIYYDGELLDKYMDYIELINKDKDHGEYFLRSFTELYGPFSYDRINKKRYIDHVKSEELIDNIEMAFKVWHEKSWNRNLSFDDFCEYLLPFRISDEIPENNRREIYTQFNVLLDSLLKDKGSAIEACKIINDHLIKRGFLYTTRIGFLPHFRSSVLIKYRTGSCREMADLATYIMRSVGIPVGNDFVPQWPYRDKGHNWNTLFLSDSNKTLMFLGTEDNPGMPHKPFTKKGKVFRRTYAVNPNSLARIKLDNELVPPLFLDDKIIDVTDQYVKCKDITVEMKNPGSNKYAYIGVFNNQNWIAIDWGKIQEGKVAFKKIEVGIVYAPLYYDSSGYSMANSPFILDSTGAISFLNAEQNEIGNRNEIIISRIFPDTPDDFYVGDFDSARFEGANFPDFKDAVELYTVPRHPLPYWNSISLNNRTKFRYVRCLPVPSMNCCLGEVAFFSGNKKLNGRIISYNARKSINPDAGPEKAMDNNFHTSFETYRGYSGWVGLDLTTPEVIDSLMFCAKIYPKKESYLEKDHLYELLFWDNNEWKHFDQKIARKKELCFTNLPLNALFILKDLTSKVKCRIFTIKDNQQIWW